MLCSFTWCALSFSCGGEGEACRCACRPSRPLPPPASLAPPYLCLARSLSSFCTPRRTHLSIARHYQSWCILEACRPIARGRPSGTDGAAIDASSEDESLSPSRACACSLSCLYLLLTLHSSFPTFSPPAGALSSSSSAFGAAQGKQQDPGIVAPPHRLLRTHARTRPCSLVLRSARPRSARDPRSAVSRGVRCVPLLVCRGGESMPWRRSS